MACGNNKGNLGGLKNILDFNVTYTGCAATCGGLDIKAGDSLRNVLDALVSNCDGGTPGPGEASTNFWFSRNIPTFTADVKEGDFALTGSGAIYEFTSGEWVDTGIRIGGGSGGGGTWGSITGTIEDQTDLTDYINALIEDAPVNPDHIGKNLHLSDDGKINAGRVFEGIPEGTNYLLLSTLEKNFPDDWEFPGIALVDESGTESLNIGVEGGINIVAGSSIEIGNTGENQVIRINPSGPNQGGRVISKPIEIPQFPTSNPSDVFAATVGYVKQQISGFQSTIDGMQSTIDAQQDVIDDLLARVQALENE